MIHAPGTPYWLIERRERVFLVLAGVFLCSMTLLNVIGITRFVQLGPMTLAVGVLAYPLTFLCTDIICEVYGKRRANFMVTLGLGLNFFILAVMWLGNSLPSAESVPPWQALELASPVGLPDGTSLKQSVELFQLLYACTSGAVFASMIAYVAAQYCDVQLFHYFKRITKGRYLWVRNNFSTLASQLVDSVTVVLVTFGATFMRDEITLKNLLLLMASNYLFKMCAALVDTPFIYLAVTWLKRYLQPEKIMITEEPPDGATPG
ncbi:queuosine precursor transporter [Porticoccaceae bacterium]|jgi:uncharacterized PurR-regulated membrane protein YhhQ (DUF165 family)|nr:queuosine precursor transporter [Porticoccaceae bacterium]MDB2395053.1 queuosine precursor transporter [Porticoccaceae bacterium]MDB2401327.1 queuosine precursor transporter [Porticoccaceae bacterium]|tara:strand:+ start:53530 stop:54318 length:789 start_codon:yes stop_codon:yes gene_type:complete